MHDFLLAQEIIKHLDRIVFEQQLSKKIKKVYIELGQVAMAHDGHPEHLEDISEENLRFGLESVAKNTPYGETQFFIRKVVGESWKITDIEV
jgi:Zn finger protein HypA/HybF involved in hydrogenase expression